jgi:hypothetical protein
MNRFHLQLLFICLLTQSLIFSQSTYYVSVNGNNSNNGLSANTAFATLQHAADIVNAGDSVFVCLVIIQGLI